MMENGTKESGKVKGKVIGKTIISMMVPGKMTR